MGRPSLIVSHKSQNTALGISGWRMMLCGLFISSSQEYWLILWKTLLPD